MTHLAITDMPQALGAEVAGFDPASGLNEENSRLLREAFDRRGVLVFRDIDIDQESQARLSEMLIGVEPRSGGDGFQAVPNESYISNQRAGAAAPFGRLLFHSDTMWAAEPFKVLSLYGVEVGAPAVPTIFASATHAWKTLPDRIKARVDGLKAVHTAGQSRRGDGTDDDVVEALPERPKSTTQPIKYRHPRTGMPILYVCEQMTHDIVGLAAQESQKLLDVLFGHLYNPSNLFHHQWRKHDLVIWDNLSVQHARANVEKSGPARTLRKFVCPLDAIATEERAFNYSSTK